MAAFTSYDSVGMAEDVSAVITNIDPMDRPFTTLTGTRKVMARNPEWQEDSYAAASTLEAAHIEGADFSDAARGATTMRSNYTEVRALAFGVSETADAVKTHGRSKEAAYQLAKAGLEVQRGLEAKMVKAGTAAANDVPGIDAAVGNATDTARTAANVWGSDPGSTQVLTNRTANTTTPIQFTEAAFVAGMLVTYQQGAPGKVLMVSPEVMPYIETWATLPAGRFRDQGLGKKVSMFVEFLVTPYGEVKVVPNRHFTAATALLFDPSYWKRGVLRDWKRIPLAKTGDANRHAVVGEFTLMHLNYAEGYGWATLTVPTA